MVEKLSGKQLLEEYASGKRDHPPMAQTIPMKMVDIHSGNVRFEVQAGKGHLNPLGMVHGGFASTVLDSVTACAVHSLLEPQVLFATIELNVKFVKPIPLDSPLWALGTVLNLSNKIGIAEGRIVDQSDQLYAHATATCMIKR